MRKNTVLIVLLFFGAISANAAARGAVSATAIEYQEVLVDKQVNKKMDRKVKRIQNQIDKFQQKREGEKKKVWTKLSFIIGLLAVIAGIVLGIAIIANPIGGFFYFLSGLLLAGGVTLILLAVSA